VTNPLNQTTTFGYNTNGELTSVTNALNETTTFGYTTAGDLTTITEPGSIVTTLDYDGAGRLTSTTDPLNHSTTLAANGRGQVTSVTNALNQTTSYSYDTVDGQGRSAPDNDQHLRQPLEPDPGAGRQRGEDPLRLRDGEPADWDRPGLHERHTRPGHQLRL
jgi:YD repeat-containing protein